MMKALPSSPEGPKIAIIGAGPAGLTLNFPAGPVALQPDGGIAALKSCGIFEKMPTDFQGNKECVVADKYGQRKWNGNDIQGDSRLFLRNDITCLISPVAVSPSADTPFYWMYKEGKRYGKAAKRRLALKGDFTEDFDIVVGADAIPGRVIRAGSEVADILDTLLGHGTFYASEYGKAIMIKRGFRDSILMHLMLLNRILDRRSGNILSPFHYEGALGRNAGPELLDRLLFSSDCFADWCDNIKVLIALGFVHEYNLNPYAARPLYNFEPEFQWEHVPGITLIGDAAHVITYFTGDGVDLAMTDALELSQELIIENEKPEPDYDLTLERFEKRMLERIPEKARNAADVMLAMFDKEVPDAFVDVLKDLNPSAEGGSGAGAVATSCIDGALGTMLRACLERT
ncbi:uncharacterized protein PAC_18937 [Phialocephala subalpina]|uniref:FAD-binding domain-containing protein n=1 Tax=Phialocephala subalpina TaxID=576137 RepID=A0A1L7XVH6_9HELO|nr:uncharacterized protein PAC_18937 [Phialocephala subalpina]